MPVRHHGIGVKEEDVLPRGLLQRQIVCLGEPQVFGGHHQIDPGELPAYHVYRPVGRCIIDDDHFKRGRQVLAEERVEALTEQLRCIPVYKDDGELHTAIIGAQRPLAGRSLDPSLLTSGGFCPARAEEGVAKSRALRHRLRT